MGWWPGKDDDGSNLPDPMTIMWIADGIPPGMSDKARYAIAEAIVRKMKREKMKLVPEES
jgi:hypothetical protein